MEYPLTMEVLCTQKSVGSIVRLKRYGSSSVKVGLLWQTPFESGRFSNRNPGRIGERDVAIVVDVDGDMVKIQSNSGGCGWISVNKLEGIS